MMLLLGPPGLLANGIINALTARFILGQLSNPYMLLQLY